METLVDLLFANSVFKVLVVRRRAADIMQSGVLQSESTVYYNGSKLL